MSTRSPVRNGPDSVDSSSLVSANPQFCIHCIYNNAKMGVALTRKSGVAHVRESNPTLHFVVYIITQKWGRSRSLIRASTPIFAFRCIYNNAKVGVAQSTPIFAFRCIYKNAKVGVAQSTPIFAFRCYIITQKWGLLSHPHFCISLNMYV
jgi:hypothetical protein